LLTTYNNWLSVLAGTRKTKLRRDKFLNWISREPD